MDLWKFFAIGHEDHVFCNPLSEPKFDELIAQLAIPYGGRILDIACGKAELLARAVARYDCLGVGVDLSPFCVAEARARFEEEGRASAIEVVEANGSEYEAPLGSFDVTCCIGATWIWGGFAPTLRALSAWTKPGGLVLVGEPFWRCAPSREYLEAAGHGRDSFGTHQGNVEAGLGLGLGFLYAMVSSEDDWDRYEGLQCNAAERYARENPSDPDVPELLARVREARDNYLRWGRRELGWAVYAFLCDPVRESAEADPGSLRRRSASGGPR